MWLIIGLVVMFGVLGGVAEDHCNGNPDAVECVKDVSSE